MVFDHVGRWDMNEWVFLLQGVITSYSIHYTKLYDVLILLHKAAVKVFFLFGECFRELQLHQFARITSYNVCYTKLLRKDAGCVSALEKGPADKEI